VSILKVTWLTVKSSLKTSWIYVFDQYLVARSKTSTISMVYHLVHNQDQHKSKIGKIIQGSDFPLPMPVYGSDRVPVCSLLQNHPVPIYIIILVLLCSSLYTKYFTTSFMTHYWFTEFNIWWHLFPRWNFRVGSLQNMT